MYSDSQPNQQYGTPISDQLSPFWSFVLPVAVAGLLFFLAQTAIDFYQEWLNPEDRGLLEATQFLVAAAAFFQALRVLFTAQIRRHPWLILWVLIAALACLYIAGEEASWGQHYFGWATPESWQAVNDQGETNLHNTSSWLDQKPRLVLEIGVILGGILGPILIAARPSLRRHAWAIIIPPFACLPTAVIGEFAKFSERLVSLSGGHSYIFYRASEVQELYFYYFILLYLVVLRRRLVLHDPLRETAS